MTKMLRDVGSKYMNPILPLEGKKMEPNQEKQSKRKELRAPNEKAGRGYKLGKHWDLPSILPL